MALTLRAALCGSLLAVALTGCSHMLENRAIDAFSAALEDGDLERLRESTSASFNAKALRSAESLDDIEILRLPTGDTSIVEVEDGEEENEKKVTVQIGDSKKKRLLYTLVENEDGRWVVDDIYVRQRRRGHTATRSVTEQMDLLLSVREFLDAWTVGGRDDVLDVTAPELGRVLSELPPSYLAQVTTAVVGSRDESNSARKPDAQLDGDRAIVTLPRDSGELVLSMVLEDDEWYVSDVALKARRESERVPSVLKRATALSTAVQFLDAYAASDKAKLVELATPTFYRHALKVADLTTVPLPTPGTAAAPYEMKLQAHRADFVLPSEHELVKLSLVRSNDEDVRGLPPVYRVEEATLYETDGSQEKRLSALFTANASMLVFADALRERNLPILRQTSSREFNRTVWDRLEPVGIEGLPLEAVADEPPRIVSTVFRGAVTEVNVVQGPRAMTYVLNGRDADLRIHDVIVPTEDARRPTSLRETLEVVTPVYLLAHGVHEGAVPVVRRSASDDFNRLVWGQVRTIPRAAATVPVHAVGEPSRVERGEKTARVVVGDANQGCEVTLVEERGLFVVDEMLLVSGPEPSQRWQLKDVLRAEVANLVGPNAVRAAKETVMRAADEPAAGPKRFVRPDATHSLDEPISLRPNASATAARLEEFAIDAPGPRTAAGGNRPSYDTPVEIDESLGDLTIE